MRYDRTLEDLLNRNDFLEHTREVTTIKWLKDETVMVALGEAFIKGGTQYSADSAYRGCSFPPIPPRGQPTFHEVKTTIEGNICRYTGFTLPLEAIMKAAEMTLT